MWHGGRRGSDHDRERAPPRPARRLVSRHARSPAPVGLEIKALDISAERNARDTLSKLGEGISPVGIGHGDSHREGRLSVISALSDESIVYERVELRGDYLFREIFSYPLNGT